MTPEDSPFQSPQPESLLGPSLEERLRQINGGSWLVLLALLITLLAHLLGGAAIWLNSQQPIINAAALNEMVEPMRQPVLDGLIFILIFLVPTVMLLNAIAVYRLWRLWDNRPGAFIMAFMSILSTVSIFAMTYVLLRAHWEENRIRKQLKAK